MTAQTKIEAHPLIAAAEGLVRGDWSAMPDGDYTFIEADQWRATAQCCLDNHADFPMLPDNFDPLQELIDQCREEEREWVAMCARDRGYLA